MIFTNIFGREDLYSVLNICNPINSAWEIIAFVKDWSYNTTVLSNPFPIFAVVTKTHCTEYFHWVVGFKFTDAFHKLILF
jgi:hypothetical protein